MKAKDLVGAGDSWIYLIFDQTDGGTQSCGISKIGGTFGWTWTEVDCVASESFDSMTISLFTTEDSGKVWFDKVKLTAVGP
jgi:hypothetical protein